MLRKERDEDLRRRELQQRVDHANRDQYGCAPFLEHRVLRVPVPAVGRQTCSARIGVGEHNRSNHPLGGGGCSTKALRGTNKTNNAPHHLPKDVEERQPRDDRTEGANNDGGEEQRPAARHSRSV